MVKEYFGATIISIFHNERSYVLKTRGTKLKIKEF